MGPLTAKGRRDGSPVRVVIRGYDLAFWRDDESGVARVSRVLPLGDRMRVEAVLDGGTPIFGRFPRHSRQLDVVEAGSRIAIEVKHVRAWPLASGAAAMDA